MPASRVVVCPQEFKGSLRASAAAEAIAAGVRDVRPGADVRIVPLADGGPGTVDACLSGTPGRRIVTTVSGPLGAPVGAAYALLPTESGWLALIEAAAACGLTLVPAPERDPGRGSSAGVGQLIADAIGRGVREIVVGVGGTGTCDGGAGAAQVLGIELFDLAGLAVGDGVLELARLARIEHGRTPLLLTGVELRLAVDVTNGLVGEEGAIAIYGPQKGVRGWEAPAFDQALALWADRISADLGIDLAELPGAGAGGGLPVGLMAAGAAAHARVSIESGAAVVAAAVGLEPAIAEADLVVTGEGSLDLQTGYGKTVAHVAELSARHNTPCVAVAGQVDLVPPGVLDAEQSGPAGYSIDEAMALGAPLLRAAAARLTARWSGSRRVGGRD